MKPSHRILVSLYLTFIVYSVISMIWGSAGIVQTSKLKIYKEKLIQNTTELREISSKLLLQSNRLRTDQRLISLKARDLGYFEAGEGEIIFKGYNKKSISYSVGIFYKRFNIQIVNKKHIRLFSLFFGIFVYLILTFVNINTPLNNKKIFVHG